MRLCFVRGVCGWCVWHRFRLFGEIHTLSFLKTQSVTNQRQREEGFMCVYRVLIHPPVCFVSPLRRYMRSEEITNTTHITMLVPRDEGEEEKQTDREGYKTLCELSNNICSQKYGLFAIRLLVLLPELSLGQKVANFSRKVN